MEDDRKVDLVLYRGGKKDEQKDKDYSRETSNTFADYYNRRSKVRQNLYDALRFDVKKALLPAAALFFFGGAVVWKRCNQPLQSPYFFILNSIPSFKWNTSKSYLSGKT